MRLTDDQQTWRAWLSYQVASVNPRARVTTDAEGWALVPGRLGQVEVTTDPAWLAVFTTRTRQVPKLLAVPGMHRHQMCDGEARMWFPADAPDTLRAVFEIIRPRLRRQLSEDQKARLVAAGHRSSFRQHGAGEVDSDLESVTSTVAAPMTPPKRPEAPETAPPLAEAR